MMANTVKVIEMSNGRRIAMRRSGGVHRGTKRPREKLGQTTDFEVILRELRQGTYQRQVEAARACRGHVEMTLARICEMQEDPEWMVRYAAMYAALGWMQDGLELPIRVLERGVKDDESDVRMMAIRVAAEREDAPVGWFVSRLFDEAPWVRREARKACEKRGIPCDPEDWNEVRDAADETDEFALNPLGLA